MSVDQDFEAFYRSTYPRLVSLGALRCGRVDVASELAQETMVRAHDRWSDLADYDSPAAWCRTVMVRLLIDHHRSRQSERRAVQRLGLRRIDATWTPALTEWRSLLTGLNSRQQTIVTLYYADDLSIDEVAAAIDATPAAVKAALFAARQKMRRTLDARRDVKENSDG